MLSFDWVDTDEMGLVLLFFSVELHAVASVCGKCDPCCKHPLSVPDMQQRVDDLTIISCGFLL